MFIYIQVHIYASINKSACIHLYIYICMCIDVHKFKDV